MPSVKELLEDRLVDTLDHLDEEDADSPKPSGNRPRRHIGWRAFLGKAKLVTIGLVVGAVLGVVGAFYYLHGEEEQPVVMENPLSADVVFGRVQQQSELVTVSWDYTLVEKYSSSNRDFFDLFDVPGTTSSYWYQYVGCIKAGVNLETATCTTEGNVITIELDEPYYISNDPDYEHSGVLEGTESESIFNQITVDKQDEFRRLCEEKSQEVADENGLLEEARSNAEEDLTNLFYAALGEDYTVEFVWRGAEE